MKRNVIDLIFELKLSCLTKEESIREKLALSPAEFRGILSIDPLTAMPCNLLSKKMGLSVSRGSRVINKMMKSGYIKEAGGSDDKRVMNVALTAKGINTQKKIHKMLEDCESVIRKKLSGTEVDSLRKSLEKISDVLIS
ncbi:MAG: MarR family transcriptional regulator [Ignavibacteriae bacterium]|nr:MAG: MarR family transcriptional regulator [Ignavibacteriota bacterium]